MDLIEIRGYVRGISITVMPQMYSHDSQLSPGKIMADLKELEVCHDRTVIAPRSIADVVADSCPVGRGVEHRIDPMPLCQREAIVEDMLDAWFALAGIEVASDDHWLIPCHLLNRCHHISCASVALVTVALVNAPVCIEVPEASAGGRVRQLGPSHKASAPEAAGADVPRARSLD